MGNKYQQRSQAPTGRRRPSSIHQQDRAHRGARYPNPCPRNRSYRTVHFAPIDFPDQAPIRSSRRCRPAKRLLSRTPAPSRLSTSTIRTNLRRLEDRFGVKITTREGWIKVDGAAEGVAFARDVFQQLHLAREKGLYIRKNEFNFAVESVGSGAATKLPDLHASRIQISAKKPPIVPKSLQQKVYVDAIKTHDLIFGIGPAGTGKTFLAMAMAVAALEERGGQPHRPDPSRRSRRGRPLASCPATFRRRSFPYLRPLYDALHDMLEVEEIQRYMDKGIIEIAPLAYMRGRTLSHSFVILDEAQNTTTEQMFMFLTRLGQDSKCVVTGDPDAGRPAPQPQVGAGGGVAGPERHRRAFSSPSFDEVDVIRHELVQRIIRAYKSHRGDKTTSLDPVTYEHHRLVRTPPPRPQGHGLRQDAPQRARAHPAGAGSEGSTLVRAGSSLPSS